jgi:hypothetical protein
MRNKLTIKEGEIQRILGLHKRAILSEQITTPDKRNMDQTKVNAKDLAGNNQKDGSSGNQKSSKDYGFTYSGGLKIVLQTGKTKSGGKGNIYFRCDQYKQGYHFKFNNVLYKNKTLSDKLKDVFCKSNKASYTQMGDQKFYNQNGNYFSLYQGQVWKWKSDKAQNTNTKDKCKARPPKPGSTSVQSINYYLSDDKKSCYSKTGGNGFTNKKECEKTCVKSSQDDQNDGDNNNRRKFEPCSFDYEMVMKAITEKCGKSGSSDLNSGTSGTSGTQGTSGTGGIENPLPVNNRLSKELYYRMIAD